MLDPNARGADYLAAAFNPVLRRVGVVYYSARATQTMPGVDDFDLKYVEWRDGALQPIETIRVVQRKVGLAIAFHPVTGEPTVAYLGGTPGFIQGMPVYWYQSDAVINRRNNGTWTETIIASTGADVTCGNPVSDRGFLVGLWPTLAYDSTGKLYFAYRDAHDAQFPQQDWAGSDIELWEGVPPNLTGTCVKAGGNDKQAWGGHLRLVLTANSQPALVSDQMFGTADTGGSNVAFQEKLAGTWSSPSFLLSAANTQSGATPAWDPQEGLGVAVIDRTTNDLLYLRRPPGSTTWAAPDPVFGTGSGGWYPSLAMDPVLHEPAIAFAVCSPRVGVTETNCLASEDDLRVAQRVAGLWRSTVVDTNGGYLPQLGFFVSGSGPGASARRVVVYRQPPALDGAGLPVSNVGELKVAIER